MEGKKSGAIDKLTFISYEQNNITPTMTKFLAKLSSNQQSKQRPYIKATRNNKNYRDSKDENMLDGGYVLMQTNACICRIAGLKPATKSQWGKQ